MSNAVTKFQNYDALDAAIGNDGGGDEPFRFKDGEFVRGFDKNKVALGTRLLMHPASISDGFIKWQDGKPTEWRIRELNNPAQLPILRETLGDTDERDWPEGKDPWAYTMMIAFKDDDGVALTFSTSSVGGKNALRKVLRDWRLVRHKYLNKVPVVALGVDSYEHKVHRTTVKVPTFEIVGWSDWDGVEVREHSVPVQIQQELNDDLPDWAS